MWQFLKGFFGTPERYWNDNSIGYMIRAECTHFFFALVSGCLGYYLMRTILSRSRWKWDDRSIFLCSLLFGVCLSITSHIIIDAFTTLA